MLSLALGRPQTPYLRMLGNVAKVAIGFNDEFFVWHPRSCICRDRQRSTVHRARRCRPSDSVRGPIGDGTASSWSYSSVAGNNPYLFYTPPSYTGTTNWPLVVNLHGCNATDDTQMHSTQMNELADSEHFLIAYPDVNSRAINGDLTSMHRGAGGDVDIVAGITRQTMANYSVDAERVYLYLPHAGPSELAGACTYGCHGFHFDSR